MRLWRHSDVICGQTMVDTKFSFAHIGCKIDGWKGAATFALIAPLVWQISRKKTGGANPPPPSGAPRYSGRPCGSTDMQHDLFQSGHDRDLKSNFQNDLLRSNYNSFDASQEDKFDAAKMNAVALLNQKLLQKILFRRKRLFLVFALWRPN